MYTKKRYDGLDILKAILAFAVICLHCPLPLKIQTCVMPLLRTAVPIFFMISGFFFNSDNGKKIVRKFALLFLSANVIYILFYFYKIITEDIPFPLKTTKSLLYFIVFNGNPFSEHLWYLGAILYIVIIVMISGILFWDKIKIQVFIMFLLSLNLIFGEFSNKLFGFSWDIELSRNFLLDGLPFFLIGNLKSKSGDFEWMKGKYIKFFVFFILFYGIGIGEILVGLGKDITLSSIGLSILIFDLFTNEYLTVNKMLYLKRIGRQYSPYIYILHPMIIYFVLKLIPFYNIYVQIIMPGCIYIITIFVYILYKKILFRLLNLFLTQK